MAIPKIRYSFAPGFQKLTIEEGLKVREEIYQLLGCTSDVMYCRRKNNYRNMPPVVYKAITDVFSRYGVSENDVWEKTEI